MSYYEDHTPNSSGSLISAWLVKGKLTIGNLIVFKTHLI